MCIVDRLTANVDYDIIELHSFDLIYCTCVLYNVIPVFSAVETDWKITMYTIHLNKLVRMFRTHLTSKVIVKLPAIDRHAVTFDVQYINVDLFTRFTEVTFTVMTVILRGPRTEAAVFDFDLGIYPGKVYGG